MQIFRRSRPPQALVSTLGLERGEHVIAWTQAADGTYLVATERALHVSGPLGAVRLNWHQISEADWRDGVLRITPARSDQGRRPSVLTWLLDRPGLIPDAVRDRVTASILVNQHVRLLGRSGVRIIGRRVPGTDELAWTLRFDPDLDPADPHLRALADAELADLRRQLGT